MEFKKKGYENLNDKCKQYGDANIYEILGKKGDLIIEDTKLS